MMKDIGGIEGKVRKDSLCKPKGEAQYGFKKKSWQMNILSLFITILIDSRNLSSGSTSCEQLCALIHDCSSTRPITGLVRQGVHLNNKQSVFQGVAKFDYQHMRRS
jgi:hypothetical protein